MKTKYSILYTGWILTMLLAAACDKTESYAELLTKEEHAVNWYLSGNAVETEVPSDSIFITGEDAPFYRMDEDGNVYMQVINAGDKSNRPSTGDRVYFRYSRMNLRNFYEVGTETWVGNSSDLSISTGSTSFVLDNYTLTSSSQYGSGIQLPMKYLGYNSRVRLVVKAQSGFYSEQSQCLPFVFDIRYFKGIY